MFVPSPCEQEAVGDTSAMDTRRELKARRVQLIAAFCAAVSSRVVVVVSWSLTSRRHRSDFPLSLGLVLYLGREGGRDILLPTCAHAHACVVVTCLLFIYLSI